MGCVTSRLPTRGVLPRRSRGASASDHGRGGRADVMASAPAAAAPIARKAEKPTSTRSFLTGAVREPTQCRKADWDEGARRCARQPLRSHRRAAGARSQPAPGDRRAAPEPRPAWRVRSHCDRERAQGARAGGKASCPSWSWMQIGAPLSGLHGDELMHASVACSQRRN
eukprot:scaffold66515_cov66-Phaeocystis_antarctica.AAC.2